MTEVDIKLPRKNFDIEINASFTNGITGVFGESGSGKTSLMHSISGLTSPMSGNISINGNIVFNTKKRINMPVEKRNIGYVFQEGRLFPHMNVRENIMYGFKKHKHSKVSFNELIDMLNLKHLQHNKPSQISGGERQRTALGRTLMSSPDILLLDEPFSAVDMNLRKQILPFIIRIQKKTDIPMLIVSHDLPDLLKLTNTLFLIKQGKCIGHNKYYNLLKSPEACDTLGNTALVNAVEMQVAENTAKNGLTLLEFNSNNKKVLVKCERSKELYETGRRIKIFINADDIALSNTHLPGITMQNQIEGTVIDLIKRKASLLCIVDVGFTLVVEITTESQQRLNINKGNKVWCMFKSVAIDIAA